MLIAAGARQNQLNNAISGLMGGASGLTSSGMKAFMGDGTGTEAGLETENVNLSASNLASSNLSNIQNNYNPVSQLPRSSFSTSDDDVFDPNTGRVIPRGGFSNINI